MTVFQLLHMTLCAVPRMGISFRRNLGYILRVAGMTNANILHSHFGPWGWEVLRVVQKAGLKHVVNFYGYDATLLPKKEPLWGDRYKEMFNEIDCVLC